MYLNGLKRKEINMDNKELSDKIIDISRNANLIFQLSIGNKDVMN